MQVGSHEPESGCIVLRADDVELEPPETDAYFRYEYVGEIPNSLAANERARRTTTR